MRSGDATENAMHCKCVAVRRFGGAQTSTLATIWSPKSKVFNLLFYVCISTRLFSYLTKTNPFLRFVLSIYTVRLPASSGDEFAANYVKGLAFGLPLRCRIGCL